MNASESARLDQVHPTGWVNPKPPDLYDFVVIGGGTAGLVCARGAAIAGARVALVEQGRLGGESFNVGDVPSKALIRTGRIAHMAREGASFGVVAKDVSVDFAAAMERLRHVRAQLAPIEGAPRLKSLGVDVYFGHAQFSSDETLQVDGATLRFKRAVIATGSRPGIPSVPGLSEVPYLTNETIFDLQQLPQRLIVLGCGPIGAELAQTFRRLGSAVTLIESGPRLLPRDDEEASVLLAARLRGEGVDIHISADAKKVTRMGDAIRVMIQGFFGEREIEGDALLISTGRKANVDSLNLQAAGVAADAEGILLDDHLRTTAKRIYAAGDVGASYRFTHAADAMARIVVQNALFLGNQRLSALTIPWATYTDPEVAQVGLTAAEAQKRGIAINTFRVLMKENDRAITDSETDGFVKVHVRKGSDHIVGASIVSSHAGDLIAPVALAMTQGLGLRAFAETILPYPTQAMALKRVADEYHRTRLTPTVSKLLHFILRRL